MLPIPTSSPHPDPPAPESSSPPAARSVGPRAAAVWWRVILACGLLLAAGGLRLWQERRVEARLVSGLDAPFSLAELPTELGDWQGQSDTLDPRIARGTGSVDNTLRRYTNRRTGVRLEVIVLYGPATDMRIHSPELCYPAAGYDQRDELRHHEIATGDDRPPALFRSLIYAKGEGGQAERQEVYYAWRYDGRWTPYVGNQKQVERIPSMFKLHVARAVTEGELRGTVNPCQDFLEQMVPEMERRLQEASASASAAASAGSGAPARSDRAGLDLRKPARGLS
ncbi:hypothetical protein BH23PLA1_BH23PLA1_04850 [soil metagenome]